MLHRALFLVISSYIMTGRLVDSIGITAFGGV